MKEKNKGQPQPSPLVYGYTAADLEDQKQRQKFIKLYNLEKLFVALTILVGLIAGGMLLLQQLPDVNIVFNVGLYSMLLGAVLSALFGGAASAVAFGMKRSQAGFTALGLMILGILSVVGYYVYFTGRLGEFIGMG